MSIGKKLFLHYYTIWLAFKKFTQLFHLDNQKWNQTQSQFARTWNPVLCINFKSLLWVLISSLYVFTVSFIIGNLTIEIENCFLPVWVTNSQLTWFCLTKQLALVTSSQMYNKYQKLCLMHTDFTMLQVCYIYLLDSWPVHWSQCLCPLSLINESDCQSDYFGFYMLLRKFPTLALFDQEH